MSILLRAAVPEDLPAINAIYNHYVLHSTCTYQTNLSSSHEREQWFARHGDRHPVVVAQQHGQVVGWAALSPFHTREAYRFTVEDSVYVDAGHQRQGIGHSLLQALIAHAGRLEYWSIIAIISADQAPSIALHGRAGFREAGRLSRVGFKFNRWLDVLYMQYDITPHQ